MEHAIIGRVATSALHGPRAEALALGWKEVFARESKADRLCGEFGARDADALCVDLPMMAALAGDHSCSAESLVATIDAPWLQPLLRHFADNYKQIVSIEPPGSRVSLWHAGHIGAQAIDVEYLSRAKQNGSHFMLPRVTSPAARPWLYDYQQAKLHYTVPPKAEDPYQYFSRVAGKGAESNAVGLYVEYHAAALAKAAQARCTAGKDGACEHPDAAREALLNEAVALHFLEDSFSAGHVVGTLHGGNKAQRVGTHDHYCEHGMTASTWAGSTYSAFGDAHMMHADVEHASKAVIDSIGQVADALLSADQALATSCAAITPPDVCEAAEVPGVLTECVKHMYPVLLQLPTPPLSETSVLGVRSEVGAFARFATGTGIGLGLTSEAAAAGHMALDASAGFGVSLVGLTTSHSDSTSFAQLGIAAASRQTRSFCISCVDDSRSVGPRFGGSLRLRMPYYIIPGDFLLFGLFYAAGVEKAWKGVTGAAEGGIWWRWQRVFPVWHNATLQIVAGREIAGTIYADVNQKDGTTVGSWSMDIPFLESVLVRRFSENSTNHVAAQLGYRLERSRNEQTGDHLTSHYLLLTVISDTRLFVSGF